MEPRAGRPVFDATLPHAAEPYTMFCFTVGACDFLYFSNGSATLLYELWAGFLRGSLCLVSTWPLASYAVRFTYTGP